MSNFNYCSLVWNFSSARSLNNIEDLLKRALRFLFNDYDSAYEDLLEKSICPNMNLRRQTLYKLSPDYINGIFTIRNTDRLTREEYKLNLEIPKPNQDTFETRSLRSYGPKIRNALPYLTTR